MYYAHSLLLSVLVLYLGAFSWRVLFVTVPVNPHELFLVHAVGGTQMASLVVATIAKIALVGTLMAQICTLSVYGLRHGMGHLQQSISSQNLLLHAKLRAL